MKKFQFRLEKIFRYHQQRLKQAELRLAQAAAEREAAQAAVTNCLEQIEQTCRLNEMTGGLINPTLRGNVTARIEQLQKNLVAIRERLKMADQRVRECAKVRADITQDVEGFSQLRDERRHEHHDEVARLQQIELDEVVMRKWSARDAGEIARPAGTFE